MDIHIWYTLLSALVGGVMGARDRLGEVYIYSFMSWSCFWIQVLINYAYISSDVQARLLF
jgi:hypothetical protein